MKPILMGVLLVVLASSCGSADYEAPAESKALADSIVTAGHAGLDKMAGIDSARKFIRTGEMKLEVKDVLGTTNRMEKLAVSLGGFVAQSDLKSQIDYKNTVAVSKDSLLESVYFTTSNEVILRVPVSKIDTIMYCVAQEARFMDSRQIKADDISLQLLENRLAAGRALNSEKRIVNDVGSKKSKLTEALLAEEMAEDRLHTADEARLSNLSLMDKVNYSTIKLNLYQRQGVKHEVIANANDIETYEPSFFLKLWEALLKGFKILESLVIGITNIWPVILVIILSVYYIRKKFRS